MISRNVDKNMSVLYVGIVPADGLAPSGAGPSAGTVMNKW